jgi:hypothetical protein
VSLPAPDTVWWHYSLDFITELLKAKDKLGYEYDLILVLID